MTASHAARRGTGSPSRTSRSPRPAASPDDFAAQPPTPRRSNPGGVRRGPRRRSGSTTPRRGEWDEYGPLDADGRAVYPVRRPLLGRGRKAQTTVDVGVSVITKGPPLPRRAEPEHEPGPLGRTRGPNASCGASSTAAAFVSVKMSGRSPGPPTSSFRSTRPSCSSTGAIGTATTAGEAGASRRRTATCGSPSSRPTSAETGRP